MKEYRFSWGMGSDDEGYSFFADMDYISVGNLINSYKNNGGDVTDYDEFENYAKEHGFEIQRYLREEPTYIHESDLEDF